MAKALQYSLPSGRVEGRTAGSQWPAILNKDVLCLLHRNSTQAFHAGALGIPEFLGGDKMMDDLCLEEDSGVAYVATHRENTIDRMSLEPDRSDERESVAGSPFNAELVKPSSGAWGRAPGEAPPRKHTPQSVRLALKDLIHVDHSRFASPFFYLIEAHKWQQTNAIKWCSFS